MKHAAKLLPSRGAPSTSMAAHRLSHAIAKQAPPRKIRIIHVLAPEVIKTEPRHFRELVQRLTGKPGPDGASGPASPEYASSPSPPPYSGDTAGDAAPAIKAEVKVEAETSQEGGGYLRALGMEGGDNEMFFQGLEDFLFLESDLVL